MKTLMTTNNAYDTILLIDDSEGLDTIVSQWTADIDVIENYLGSALTADNWDVQDSSGLKADDGSLFRIHDFGRVCGEFGRMDEDRRAVWMPRLERRWELGV